MRIAVPYLALLLGWSLPLAAQELTPRYYWPAPTGTQILTVGAVYTSGDTIPDPSLPLSGVDSRIATGYLGYLRTVDLFGRTANLIADLPYSKGDTKTVHEEFGRIERDYEGIGDLSATLSVNLMGAPAMTRQDFAELRRAPRPILGASLKIVAPTGKYDNDRIINVGSNRWAAKVGMGYILPLRPRWLLELQGGLWLFDDNDDFLGMTREQDEIYFAQLHLIRRFSPGFWASLDLNGYRGGRSKVDGRRLNDLQRDSKIGVTLVYPFSKRQAVKLSYAQGSVNDSDKSFDIYTVSLQHLF